MIVCQECYDIEVIKCRLNKALSNFYVRKIIYTSEFCCQKCKAIKILYVIEDRAEFLKKYYNTTTFTS